jgi:Domain of unknown function (DUF6894)
MPRFRFHIHENGRCIEDDEGLEFDDEVPVRREALETGAPIARDVFISGTAKKVIVEVHNEDTPFLKVSISLVVEEGTAPCRLMRDAGTAAPAAG